MSANAILSDSPESNNSNSPNPHPSPPDFTLDEIEALIDTMDGIITVLTTWQAHSPYRLAKLNLMASDFALHIYRIAQESEVALEAEAIAHQLFGSEAR